jgi:hypothetical protein
MILVKEADSDSVAQIAEEICEAGKGIRLKTVSTHKKRVELLKLLPSFLIAVLDHTLPHLPPWSLYPGMIAQNDALGSTIATSVGGFGYIDVSNSFFGSTGSGYGRTS